MKWKNRHKSTGKAYPYIEKISNMMYWGFFKKIYLNNFREVPDDCPTLIASNHPTAFIECAMVTAYIHAPVYNMARGDIFRKPFYRKLMESINMFPVYRKRDGYAESDRNEEVFEYCIDKLKNNGTVAIYVEGEHHSDKRVRPLQKGIARIAFATFERYQQQNLTIFPMGNNFVREGSPRDEIMMNIGEPIYVRDYWPTYQESPAHGITQLCKDIEQALQKICFHLENAEDDDLAEKLLTLHRSEYAAAALPIMEREHPRFAREKAVLDHLNSLAATEKQALQNKVNTYFDALQKAGIADETLVKAPRWGNLSWLLFFAGLLLPFLVGFATSWPLLWLSHTVARKTVKKKIFFGSVVMGTAFLSGIVWYGLILLISLFTLHPFWIAAAVLLPPLGWFSMIYREQWTQWLAARRALANGHYRSLLELREKTMDNG
jgi:1-acyl-sn-glycerol-3-phosphate acyltransferase